MGDMETDMEMMQQQQQQQKIVVLVSMGFSEQLAAEALKATAGDILKATDWILSRTQSCPNPNRVNDYAATSSTSNPTSTPPSSSSSSTLDNPDAPPPSSLSKNITSNFQPKIDRFFHFPPKTPTIPHCQIQNISIVNDNTTATAPVNAATEQIPQPQPPSQPLSERMRPQTLHQVVGQDHILGPSSALRSTIRCCRLPSLLLWGPPGTGKTSIARAIVLDANTSNSSLDSGASVTGYRFVQLSAVNSGVKDVRDAVDEARSWDKSSSFSKTLKTNKKRRLTRTVLFIDEVHRFNKAQQDSPRHLSVISLGSISK